MTMPSGKSPWQWLIRVRTSDGWKTAVVSGEMNEKVIAIQDGASAKEVLVSGISRLGREGPRARTMVGKGANRAGEK